MERVREGGGGGEGKGEMERGRAAASPARTATTNPPSSRPTPPRHQSALPARADWWWRCGRGEKAGASNDTELERLEEGFAAVIQTRAGMAMRPWRQGWREWLRASPRLIQSWIDIVRE
jgi:hypothetical protein